jgi:hypothetical protein
VSNGVDWSVWDKSLGAMPDKKLSRVIGCSEDTVINRRRKLNIPAFTQGLINWAAWDRKLGKKTDQALAKEMKCAVRTVQKRRMKLGINAFKDSGNEGKPRKIDWEKWDKILGSAPDWEVAKKIGCSIRPVEKRRKKLHIESFNKHARIDWTAWDKDLGKAHDWQTATSIGCSMIAVEQRREKLGIKPYSKNDRIDWSTWDSTLGKSDDRTLSERIGCSASSILRRRKKLNIPAFIRKSGQQPLFFGNNATQAERKYGRHERPAEEIRESAH